MKKSILLFAVALGMLTACDPIKEEGSMAIDSFTASSLLDGAQFSQYADQACTTPQSDGNWIKYSVPKASSVYIYYLKADGSEFKLASGSSAGVFNFVPARGSDPLQTVYFRYQNAKGEETVASVDFTVQVASELKPEIRLLASNDYGKKTWKWDPSITGAVWGNMGYQPGDGTSVGTTGNGQWWGVTTTEEFNGQLQHTEDGTNHGDGDLNAYMVFTEDGLISAYDASGSVIRSGTFEVKDYNPGGEMKIGDLVTNAILWPYEINSGGNIPGTYEIAYVVLRVLGARLHSGTSAVIATYSVWPMAMTMARTGLGTTMARTPYGVTWVTAAVTVSMSALLTMVSGGVSPTKKSSWDS